jgi:hypothetical protein
MSHTPGPWQTKDVGHGHCIHPNVAWVGQTSKQPREETAANARLIAAAPELLDVMLYLEKILSNESEKKFKFELNRIRHAIANAKGRKR